MFPYPQHYPVFNVEQNFLFFTVVPDECMKCITVRNPTNQTTVGGQWNHSIPLSEEGKKTNDFLQNEYNTFQLKTLFKSFQKLSHLLNDHHYTALFSSENIFTASFIQTFSTHFLHI